MNKETVKILLVEDSLEDVDLTREALKESRLNVDLIVVHDGLEATNYLFNERDNRPDLMILDLNLPKKNGLEVLSEIKSDNDLKTLPVLILTTSGSQEDIVKTYSHHANCYICKPNDVNKFMEIVQSIEDFWLTRVKLPGKGGCYDR